MLVLKETRLAHDEKAIANTALLASAGSSCTSPGGCRSSAMPASSGGATGAQSAPTKSGGGSGNKKKGGGFRKGNSGGNGGGGRAQQQANIGASTSSAPQPYRPMGPWFCFNPWAPQMPSPVQQQGSGAWRPGILAAAP